MLHFISPQDSVNYLTKYHVWGLMRSPVELLHRKPDPSPPRPWINHQIMWLSHRGVYTSRDTTNRGSVTSEFLIVGTSTGDNHFVGTVGNSGGADHSDLQRLGVIEVAGIVVPSINNLDSPLCPWRNQPICRNQVLLTCRNLHPFRYRVHYSLFGAAISSAHRP